MLRLAAKHTMLPSEFMGVRKRDRDRDLDFLLTMALDIHDNDLLCSCGCGFYATESRDEDAEGRYQVADDQICKARGALEEFQKGNPDLEPGTVLRIVDTQVEGDVERIQSGTDGKRPKLTAADDTLG